MRRLWRCSDLFDERQMQLRGKVCRHALMLIVLLMLAESIVREECGPLWRPVESALVMLMLVGGYAGMRLILADAYVGYDARGKLLMGVMTLLGIACLACNVVDALGGTWTLVQQDVYKRQV